MACRCGDINKCERDIALLGAEINRRLNSARDNDDHILSKHPSLSQALSRAVYAGNLDKVSQRFSAIKKQRSGFADNLQSKRSGELSRLRSRLDSYRNEDRRYHDMLAQKAGS